MYKRDRRKKGEEKVRKEKIESFKEIREGECRWEGRGRERKRR